MTNTHHVDQVLTILSLENILFGKVGGNVIPIVPTFSFPEFKLAVAYSPKLFGLLVRLDLGKVTTPFEVGVVDEFAGIAVGLPGRQLLWQAKERWLIGDTFSDVT